MYEPEVGMKWRGKTIREKRRLSNGWILLKTDNAKSPADFKVKVIISLEPRRSMTPKHAHFLIDFYGKLCANKTEGMKVLRAIVRMWHGAEVTALLKEFEPDIRGLPGYSLEYILYALSWILEQEDINLILRKDPSASSENLMKYVVGRE